VSDAWYFHPDRHCKDHRDLDAFFGDYDTQVQLAATVCRGCPVIFECGEEARREGIEYGLWGGMPEGSAGRKRLMGKPARNFDMDRTVSQLAAFEKLKTKIRTDYPAVWTITLDIADEYDLSLAELFERRLRNGSPAQTAREDAMWRVHYKTGMSPADIASVFGFDRSTVAKSIGRFRARTERSAA
jgi:hypothetical protein